MVYSLSLVAAAFARPAIAAQPLVVFGESGQSLCRYSIWSGSSWGDISSSPSTGDEPRWVITRNAPTRSEQAVGTLDYSKDVRVMFFNGSSWSASTLVDSDTGIHNDRAFDIAYEQVSGDLLIAYWNHTQKKIGYRTYDGTSISSELLVTLPANPKIRFLQLTPQPGGNEIILSAMNDSNDLYAIVWNGTTFGSVTTVETNAKTDGNECFSAAYETLSGHALLVYSEKGVDTPRYRTWNGTSWSSELSLPNFGAEPFWSRLVADPNSDKMLFAALDTDKDINVCAWDGSSWGSNLEVETSVQVNNRRIFDIAYENGGTRALLVYGENPQTLWRYRTWDGTTWSAEKSGPELGDKPQFIALAAGQHPGEIFIAASDAGDDLNLVRWNGVALSENTQLSGALSSDGSTEQFSICNSSTLPLRIVSWREIPNPDPLSP